MSNDIFDKIDRGMERDLGQYARMGHGYFSYPKLEGDIGPRMRWRGKEVLVWSLNNYLGLANHPEVREADAKAAADYGFAYPMGSRMLTGNSDYHEQFEREAAEFVDKEDTFLLNFGYQGCASIIQSLTDRRDVIVYDSLAHACILDGMSMSLAKRFMYAHNDMEQLEDRLQKAQRIVEQTGGGILVITEGVFGMKGDMGRLDLIVALKKKYSFRLFVDDAHGFGVMGQKGQGTGEHYGVQKEIDVLFYTFAKTMALIGAFVAGPSKVIQFLRYNMRSQIYAKSLPLPLVIGALKRLDLMRKHPEYKDQLWTITHALQGGLRDRGFDLGITASPVTPVQFQVDSRLVTHVIRDLREDHGVFASGVAYPVIEKGYVMIRFIPTSVHSLPDVEYTLGAFTKIAENISQNTYATKQLVLA